MYQEHLHFSLDTERAVLGACLLEPAAFARTEGLLQPEYFYHEAHAVVYRALQNLRALGSPIDLLTVQDHLIRALRVPVLGGTDTTYYLTVLTREVVGTANLEWHCGLLASLYAERELLRLTQEPMQGSAGEKIGALQSRLQQIAGTAKGGQEWAGMDELVVQLYQHQQKLKATGGMGVPTGIRTIDREHGGFHEGQVIVLGARPSVGKSALLGQIAVNMARAGKKVGILSLEMGNAEVAARLCAIDTQTDFDVLFRGLYRDQREAESLYHTIRTQTVQLPIKVSDTTRVNISDIRAKAERLKRSYGLDVLFLDYLQLVSTEGGKNSSREREVADLSRGCKIMASEMNIPVVVLCQLNRGVTSRKAADRYPQLQDLRESGAIEQDADAVIFLHSDWMSGVEVNEQGGSTEAERDLIVRKWRNGRNNYIIHLDFMGAQMRFRERPGLVQLAAPKEEEEENPF